MLSFIPNDEQIYCIDTISTFIKNYKPKEIISYTDRRWNKGDLYNKLNFKFIEDTEPNWFIISGNNFYFNIHFNRH